MRQALAGRILAAAVLLAVLAAALAACSPGPVIDRLPGDMGLPAGAPARPAEAYQYPAVHDMPPPRPDQPLTEEQEVKMEQDLQNARDRQEGRPAGKPGKKAAKPEKKKVPSANATQATGSKSNP
jgi:hypothetical protein